MNLWGRLRFSQIEDVSQSMTYLCENSLPGPERNGSDEENDENDAVDIFDHDELRCTLMREEVPTHLVAIEDLMVTRNHRDFLLDFRGYRRLLSAPCSSPAMQF